ncbi:hypothetical protein [Rhodophyticola porphyridii]|uniref:Uncharacterized protein n=1 Tax=Rhodophyticola porphyridii TaxID=1852017 RepID=A0A3L9Y607_9RHOB|nr:hypothetical protein [Rhodophyticola porphyridii]RMA44161.1 hypothetical protein D9R08_04500 [Rhodophyticola porphyridii]
MKKYLTTTAVSLALAASPALADDTDIDQILHGVQVALNAIYAGDGGDDITQAATNAGNIIARGADSLDDIYQAAVGVDQMATNYVNSTDGFYDPAGPFDGFEDVTQTATNVLNSLSMEAGATVETITQRTIYSGQAADNSVFFDGDSVGIDQSALNAANLVNAPATDLTENVRQVMRYSDQTATNSAIGDDYFDDLTDVVQSALNVANSVSGANLDDVTQRMAHSSQRATNTIVSQDDLRATRARNPNLQDAVNAANLINFLEDAQSLKQVSVSSEQIAYNMVLGPDIYPGNPNFGDVVENLDQTATNVTNSVSVPETADLGDGDIETLVQRSRDLVQRAGNLIDMGDSIDDVTQTATNAANIAQFDDIEGSVDQRWAQSYQTATNVVAFGLGDAGIYDLTQTATNVVNSLSGDDIKQDGTDVVVSQVVDMSGLSGQLAGNFVSFGSEDGEGLVDVAQSATNAANMISLNELQGVTVQNAYFQQVAGNVAVPNLASFFMTGSGDILDLDQSAVNAVNVISADELPDIQGATDISQFGSGFQLATNIAATTASVSGVTQAATNVANSIGMPSAGSGN